ncbi:hypothetical protein EV142_102243 [Flavobacterium circumlabens]|uniref:Uncharacterized protein n=1 Tax=Flavobacterium circumlabens TaxID=2133765 RepID=A0ABY2B195_9FLAO|nr:hypothetical protein EV142_102243 [Flavobacterium circumlabens]
MITSDDKSKSQPPKIETQKPELPKLPTDMIERNGDSTTIKTR